MQLTVRPGTRDEKWGGSYYCSNPECEHREWAQRPQASPDAPDWRIEEYQRRGEPHIAQITDQIYLGDIVDAWLVRDTGTGQPFDAILNVGNRSYDPPPDVEYANIPITEYGSKPGKRKRRDRDFAAAVEQLDQWVGEGKKVFVHCVAGANRSAAVIMAALMQRGESYRQALGMVRGARPVAYPHGEVDLTLRRFIQQGEATGSAILTDPQPLQPTGKRAADEAAQFIAETNWEQPFEVNYRRIEMADVPLEQDDPGEGFFEPQTPSSERFVRADVLMDQALGRQHYNALKYPEAPPKGQNVDVVAAPRKDRKTPDMFKTDEPEFLGLEEHPSREIKPPQGHYYELLSKRGLKLPAPEVFGSDRYQKIYQRAPRIPLDPRDPESVGRAIEFVKNTKGLLMGHKKETAGEYFLCPTEFGNQRVNHVCCASWFAIFSANTAVESEETSFVLWQAGKSGSGPGKPGIMSKKPKIIEWLTFLQWAGFPTFEQLDQTMEGFDTEDESYERRMIALARLPGFQFKVASFFLALMGDTRSPTLDMHALGYLIEKGSIELDEGQEWTKLSTLADMAKQLKEISRQIGTGNFEYQNLRAQYDELAVANKDLIAKMTRGLVITPNPPKTQKGLDAEKKKIREYMRRQMEGWNGETNKFWLWYSSNPNFTTHEPRRDMIHSVFFQSLFPELFTPEAMAGRDELFEQYTDPELVDERQTRMRYRDYGENLQEMRQIQPRKQPVVAPTPDMEFDWSSGEFSTPPAPVEKPKRAPKVKREAA